MPDNNKKIPSLRLICLMSFCPPEISTIIQAIHNTTVVRMAVPRFDSIFSIPILPKMEVRLANIAESNAKNSQPFFCSTLSSVCFLATISNEPMPIPSIPKTCGAEIGSPKRIHASRIVRTVLDLSMGATLFTSPSCNALK